MEKKSLGSRLASSEGFLSVVASLICIIIGLALGTIVLALINAEHAFNDGLMVILKSGIKSPRNMGTVLANAAPLIMTGLSVGFAFKTGLFNIGAAGQYTLGAFGALYCAIVLQLPWYLCLLAAMIFGAVSPQMMTATVTITVASQVYSSPNAVMAITLPSEESAMLTKLLPIKMAESVSS